MKLNKDVLNALKSTTVEKKGGAFIVPPLEYKLKRSDYRHFNDIMETYKGKWKTNVGHVFPFDPIDFIQDVINSGEKPKRNPNEFFPTPEKVIDVMMFGTPTCCVKRILEPSAGTGAIVERTLAYFPKAKVVAIENDKLNVAILRSKFKDNDRVDVVECRFEDYDEDEKFDLVLMNPPFKYALEHLEKAMRHTNDNWGVPDKVISVLPNTFIIKFDKKKRTFETKHMITMTFYYMPPGTFKESGTNVDVIIGEWAGNPTREEERKLQESMIETMEILAANDRMIYEEYLAIEQDALNIPTWLGIPDIEESVNLVRRLQQLIIKKHDTNPKEPEFFFDSANFYAVPPAKICSDWVRMKQESL